VTTAGVGTKPGHWSGLGLNYGLIMDYISDSIEQ